MASRAKADERARQAEMDAARAREIEEERLSRTESVGSTQLRKLNDALPRIVTARVVREYIRSEMVEPIVKRMYDIGMGVETFDVPTMAGNVVTVPASPLTQLKALLGLVQIGVPSQVGLVDDDGQTLPGVVALGELGLSEIQQQGARLGQISQAFGAMLEQPSGLSPGMQERVERGEYTIVEVDEGIGSAPRHSADVPPPPIDTSAMTPEQIILAKRKARKATNGAANGR